MHTEMPNAAGGVPFDMQKLFRPSTPPPNSAIPNFPNNNNNNAVTSINTTTTATSYPFQYHPVYTPPYSQTPPEFANVHPQRTMSFPTPPLQPQLQSPNPNHHNFPYPPNSQNPNNSGAHLMALLSGPAEIPQQPSAMPLPSAPGLVISNQGTVMRMSSSKLPKGRHLIGDNLVYDINFRFPGEVQPQLEVTPITKYVSDPGLVVGRQIAVNRSYICYGLKLGSIRVLNINTALRSLLKGFTQCI